MTTSIQTAQGSTRLVFDSVEGITNTVERVHENIARHSLLWTLQAKGPVRAHGMIASAVYSMIRGVNATLREGVDGAFGLVPEIKGGPGLSAPEIRMAAALNGAFGDYLEDTGNALTLPMSLLAPPQQLELDGEALAAALPQASPHLVVLVHGLGLSELSWKRQGARCLGSRLQEQLECTPVYLRYNSGRHISTNGQEFSELLERLCEAWPVPVESLSLVGHSMGGLLIRSACWYAEQAQRTWLQLLRRVVCLGTPHHGSPLEKAGHAFNAFIRKLPYTQPLAIGRQRSAGVKDLRYGYLLDEDWQGHHPDRPRRDARRVVPLLAGVDYYFAAATLGKHSHDPLGHLLGDMLVGLDSAVGSHQDELRHLDIDPENCRVFHEKHHFDLLDDEQVHRQIIDWFNAG